MLHSRAHVKPFGHQISSRTVVHASAQTLTALRLCRVCTDTHSLAHFSSVAVVFVRRRQSQTKRQKNLRSSTRHRRKSQEMNWLVKQRSITLVTAAHQEETIDSKDQELLALRKNFGQKKPGPSENISKKIKQGIRDNKRPKRHEKCRIFLNNSKDFDRSQASRPEYRKFSSRI